MRAYMMNSWPITKKGDLFADLYLCAEITDGELDGAHRAFGSTGVGNLLMTSNTIEHLITKIAAEHVRLKYGDECMYQDLLTAQPLGDADLFPKWRIDGSRDVSKVLLQQTARLWGGRPGVVGAATSDDHDGDGRRKKKPKPKKKPQGKHPPGGKAPPPKKP